MTKGVRDITVGAITTEAVSTNVITNSSNSSSSNIHLNVGSLRAMATTATAIGDDHRREKFPLVH